MSPTPGRSTLITSAPSQARSCVQVGPDCTCVKSRMRTPSSALDILCSCLLDQSAARIEIAYVATLAARSGVDDRVDQRGFAGCHRGIDRALQFVWRRDFDADTAKSLDHPVV